MDQRLSENFWLREFLRSETAEHYGIEMSADEQIVSNLTFLCTVYLEPIRFLLGEIPLIATSGYRPPPLNAVVYGAMTTASLDAARLASPPAIKAVILERVTRGHTSLKDSAHMFGLATDFVAVGLDSLSVADRIAGADLEFDQLIYYGSRVHLGVPEPPYAGHARREVLTKTPDGYEPGIVRLAA